MHYRKNMNRSRSLSDFTLLKKKYLYNFFQKNDLKKVKVDGFNCFVIPEQYYIWKGIQINDPKNKWFIDGIRDHEGIFDNISSNFFADKGIASLYGTKLKGVDLQFKIVKDIVLIDLSDFHNIQRIWRFFSELRLSDVDQYPYIQNMYKETKNEWLKKERLQKKYPTEDALWEKFIQENFKEVIVETIANFEYDKTTKTIKSPTKTHRRSTEWFDHELVKMICNVFGNSSNGWIYFKKIGDDFHDEILLCKAKDSLIYIDHHKK